MSLPNTLSREELVKQLEELTKGLFYMSESDYPLEVVVLDRVENNIPIPTAILALTKQPSSTQVFEETLTYFFRNMTKDRANADEETRKQTERFRILQNFMEQHLQEVKVYRLGKREIIAYALGKTADNDYIGFKTIVVET